MNSLFIIISLALVFDFLNGFHDAANSIATIVSTKVLTPVQGVIWAATFNFVAFFIAKYVIGEFGIADTVSRVVYPEFITLRVIMAGISAAIIWNLITWWFGIPSSSSHTLIGGFAGGAIAVGGFSSIHGTVIGKIILFIFVAPVIGFIAGLLITSLVMHIARHAKPHLADFWFKKLQLVSSALLSIGHGLNDTQNLMGIMCAALIAFNMHPTIPADQIPHWLQLTQIENMQGWIPIACFIAIAIGTTTGGYRIMKTMGSKITKITPIEGFCSQVASAITLFLTELLKIPVSTTHVISGSIMGVGSIKRLSAVRWGVSLELIVAWIITIPISALIAITMYYFIGLFL